MAWRGLEILRLLEAEQMLTFELARATGIAKDRIRSACKTLASRGLITSENGVHGLTEAGRSALVGGGADLLTGPRKGTCPERFKDALPARAWRVLRIRQKACLDDMLTLLCSDPEAECKTRHALAHYLRALTTAGYLVELPRRGGQNQREVRWLLVRNTGPCSPTWNPKRHTVTDGNTGTVYPLTEVTEASHD
ncbi:winged helix-turn-helix domain-containing protein [Humidesulfovibrio idahonensis]